MSPTPSATIHKSNPNCTSLIRPSRKLDDRSRQHALIEHQRASTGTWNPHHKSAAACDIDNVIGGLCDMARNVRGKTIEGVFGIRFGSIGQRVVYGQRDVRYR